MIVFLLLGGCSDAGKPDPADSVAVDCATGQAADALGVCVPAACVTLPEGDRYVAEGGSGDGSAEAPSGDLQSAADLGGTVVIGPGTWPGLSLDDRHDGLALVGRCVDLVVLDGAPGIRLDADQGTRVALSGLTVTGTTGIEVVKGTVAATEVVVDGADGVGVSASGSGAALELTDVRVLNTAVLDRVGGNGGRIEDGADLTATRTVFDANHDVGLKLTGRGTRGTLTDVTVSNTTEARDGEDGWGLRVSDGADVTATGLLVSGNASVGLVAGSSGTSFSLTDGVIENTQAGDNDAVGYGAQLGFGGIVSVTRTEIRDSVGIGLVLSGSSTVVLEDIVIQGVSGPAGVSLDCLYAEGGVVVEADRVRMSECGSLGAGADGPGTVLRLRDSEVLGPRVALGDYGSAVYVENGADAELTRLTTETTGVVSVVVSAATAALTDVTMIDGRGVDGAFGWGVAVSDGGQLEADTLVLDGMRELGLLVEDVGSFASLRDVTITNTTRSVGSQGAVGLATQLGGALEVSGFNSTVNQGPALLVLSGGSIVADGGSIDGSLYAGVALLGGSLQLADTTITDGAPDPALGGGVGLFASARETYSQGALDIVLRGVTIGAHPISAVWIEDGADGSFDFEDVDFTGGAGVALSNGARVHGNALYAYGTRPWDGARGLSIRDAVLHDATGCAVLLDAGTATIDAVWEANANDLVQQKCADAPVGTYGGTSDVVLCPPRDQLTLDLAYATYPDDPEAER